MGVQLCVGKNDDSWIFHVSRWSENTLRHFAPAHYTIAIPVPRAAREDLKVSLTAKTMGSVFCYGKALKVSRETCNFH